MNINKYYKTKQKILPMKLKIKLLFLRTWACFDMWRKGYEKDDLMLYLIDENNKS